MKAVRFRCPKCQTQHSALATRAGQAFVCKVCFGPLIVPGATDAPSTEVPTAASMPRIEPPAPTPAPVEAVARPRPAPKRPARVERPAPAPMPEPIEVEPDPTPTSPSKPRRRLRVDRRSTIAAAIVLLVATIAVIVGLQPGRGVRGHAHSSSLTFESDDDAQALLAAPVEPPSAPEVKPPAPAVEPAVAPPPPPAPLAKPEPPAIRNDPHRPLVIRRRQTLDQEALRRQLAELPEMGASDETESALIALHHVTLPAGQARSLAASGGPQPVLADRIKRKSKIKEGPTPDEAPAKGVMHVARDEGAPQYMLAMIREKQPELAALPWRMGDECHLGRESAEDLQVVSRALRTLLAQSTPQGDTRPDADLLRAALLQDPAEEEATPGPPGLASLAPIAPKRRQLTADNRARFVVPAAIPALQQLLMAERTPVRVVLVDVLEKIQCREATKGLAKLAMFDLAPEVRERAMLALRARPPEEYRSSLLGGLRYPWAPVADHAAEALVALGDREAVPGLVELLDQLDPARPRTELRDGRPTTMATSLVQVNHLQNCVLCHAPSGDATKDYVRGKVPDESQPLPPPVEYYANSSSGLFVRADVTYLRQDFSVTQPVAAPGPWPAYQRYDYLIVEKPASRWSRSRTHTDPTDYPQRESVLFALRELTGRDLGSKSDAWKAEIHPQPPAESTPPPSAE